MLNHFLSLSFLNAICMSKVPGLYINHKIQYSTARTGVGVGNACYVQFMCHPYVLCSTGYFFTESFNNPSLSGEFIDVFILFSFYFRFFKLIQIFAYKKYLLNLAYGAQILLEIIITSFIHRLFSLESRFSKQKSTPGS